MGTSLYVRGTPRIINKFMKTKLLLVLALVFSLGSFSTAHALSIGVDVNTNAEVKTQGNATSSTKTEVKGNATSSSAKSEVHGNATSSGRTEVKGNATSSIAKLNAETHGSAVVAIVKALLNAANRDGGIGAEVRVVAQSQNDSASTTVNAMTQIEKRGLLRRILFGSDHKNLGQLRSAMVKTENNIEKLKELIMRTSDAQLKAELNTQVNALADSEVKLESFIKAHESSFSLLGWVKSN